MTATAYEEGLAEGVEGRASTLVQGAMEVRSSLSQLTEHLLTPRESRSITSRTCSLLSSPLFAALDRLRLHLLEQLLPLLFRHQRPTLRRPSRQPALRHLLLPPHRLLQPLPHRTLRSHRSPSTSENRSRLPTSTPSSPSPPRSSANIPTLVPSSGCTPCLHPTRTRRMRMRARLSARRRMRRRGRRISRRRLKQQGTPREPPRCSVRSLLTQRLPRSRRVRRAQLAWVPARNLACLARAHPRSTARLGLYRFRLPPSPAASRARGASSSTPLPSMAFPKVTPPFRIFPQLLSLSFLRTSLVHPSLPPRLQQQLPRARRPPRLVSLVRRVLPCATRSSRS